MPIPPIGGIPIPAGMPPGMPPPPMPMPMPPPMPVMYGLYIHGLYIPINWLYIDMYGLYICCGSKKGLAGAAPVLGCARLMAPAADGAGQVGGVCQVDGAGACKVAACKDGACKGDATCSGSTSSAFDATAKTTANRQSSSRLAMWV